MARPKKSIWRLRNRGEYPNAEISQSVDLSKIKIAIYHKSGNGFSFEIDRKTARLLAKRINQMLDFTK